MPLSKQRHGLRYQVADGIIDYIHVCWFVFLLAPAGTFTLAPASTFGSLRTIGPDGSLAALMALLAVAPIVARLTDKLWAYVGARAASALWFGHLTWLCLTGRPYSTGLIYVVVALGAAALALAALARDRAAQRGR